MLNNVNQLSCDGTDDKLTSLPEDKITSVYGKSQQLADSAKALITKGVTWSKDIIWRDKRDYGNASGIFIPGQINLSGIFIPGQINLVEVKMQLDTVPNLNKTLCAFTRLYDKGFDQHIVHGGTPKHKVPEGFTGNLCRYGICSPDPPALTSADD